MSEQPHTYTGRIAELEKQNAALREQIKHQKVGSVAVQEAMQRQDRTLADLQRENQLLKSGLAMCSPAALWPDPA